MAKVKPEHMPMARAFIKYVPSRALAHGRMVELTLGMAREFPMLAPQKFGRTEPMKARFDPATFTTDLDLSKIVLGWIWTRKSPQVDGHWFADDGPLWTSHSIDADLATCPQRLLLELLAWYARQSAIAMTTCHALSMAEAERAHARRLGEATGFRGDPWCIYYGPSLHSLIYGIRDLSWATIFGPMYCQYFGKDRLLSCPAPVVREVAPDSVLVQLSEDLHHIQTDWPRFCATREAVIDHLGRESFNRLRTPQDPPATMPAYEKIVEVDEAHVPRELLTTRREHQQRVAAMHRPPEEELPPSVTSLDEMLADAARFKIASIAGSRVIIDTRRREMISIADETQSENWIKQLVAAGAVVSP